MSDLNERSPYWLSPGIDVPSRAELVPGMRVMRGLHVAAESAEAAFIPTDEFMRTDALWRLDVLRDVAEAIERTRRHALVDYFRSFDGRIPGVTIDRRLEAFSMVCELAGIDLPPNIEAILVLDEQFTAHGP